MALITAPTLRLAAIEWTLDRPAQINTDVSNKRTIDTVPLYGKWFATVDLTTYESEALFAPVRSFLMRCNGPVNTFNLPATVDAQNANSGVTLGADAAAGATSVTLSGTTTALTDGQMVTIAGQLLQLTADQSGSTITFEPPLRDAVLSGAAVETANPYAVVRLADTDVMWAVEPIARFTASFNVEERVVA